MAKKRSRKIAIQKARKDRQPRAASLSQPPWSPPNKMLVCLALTLLAAFAFIFIFDIAGESAGERHNPLLSGTNRALSIRIRLENWLNALPPPPLFTWNEPLLKNSLRARVPEAFPDDREAMVFAGPEDAAAKLPSLLLHFQYNADDHSAEEASAIITRLAAVYIDALREADIRASAPDDPAAQINNFPALFLTLILIKSAAAAFMALFLLSLLSIWLQPRMAASRADRMSSDAGLQPRRMAASGEERGFRGAQKYITVFIAAAVIFLAGSLGLILCNLELLTKSEYASYLPPSVLRGQPISVTPAAGGSNPAGEYDWKVIPQSSRFILALLRREDPTISEEEARAYMLRTPMEAKLMRGEQLKSKSDGWHFTVRVATNALGQRDAASERWLSELFWQMKTSYESFLAADGLTLSAEGEPYTLDPFPPPRAHTRARSLAAFGLCCLVMLGWYIRKKRARA